MFVEEEKEEETGVNKWIYKCTHWMEQMNETNILFDFHRIAMAHYAMYFLRYVKNIKDAMTGAIEIIIFVQLLAIFKVIT